MSASPQTGRICALSITLLALSLGAGVPNARLAAADGDDNGGVSRTPADQEAEGLYVQGRQEQEEGRLDDAIRHLEAATRLQPANEQYAKALAAARSQAGVDRDPRAETVNRMADEQAVKQQQLWVEAEAKADEGTKLMEAGSYDEAERAFEMAEIRLENLPFADERRAGELRRVQALTKEAESRRESKEQQDTAARNQEALDRQQQLRDISLKIERDRIDAMLQRAERARQRRDFDEAILLCEQVLKINRAEDRASSLLATCRRERHVYLRQMTADRWDEEHRLLSEQIRTAMLPQLEIITYSPEWAELDARRTAPTRGLDDDQHETWRKTINDQLEQEVTLDFADTDLSDVVAFLQKITSVNIVLDPRVTAATPPPVTLKVEKMKLKYVLDFIMKLSGLNYVLRDEAIFISNTEGVRGDIYMKLYDVRDLTHAMQSFPGPDLDIPEPGGQGAKLLPPVQQEDAPETSEFIDIIQKVVAPDRWTREGVSIEEYNGSMVVTQTADVHKQVEELLRALRNQRGTQIHCKVRFLEIENSALEAIGVNWNNFTGPNIPNVAALTPLPGQTVNNGTPSNIGGYYANPTTGTIAAAALNNQLQTYQTADSLKYTPGTEGLNLNTQYWKVANNFYASAVVNAVEKERKGNVIFEPDLTMFNGQQAHIVNMNQQAYVADYNVVQGQYQPIVTVLSYGTVLDVQAIASADKKYITLTMRPTNAQVVEWRRFGPVNQALQNFAGGTVVQAGEAIGTSSAANGGGVNQLSGNGIGFNPILIPELKYESVRTSVTIPDGGSLVLAGMTNGESAHAHSGIPFLSHIPFLGRLFSSNGRQDTELKTMIVVQADVVLFEEIEKSL